MSSILFFGDTHGDHRHVLPIVQAHKPDAIVFLGDMEPEKPFHLELKEVMKLTEIWWIHGNHDVDRKDRYDHLFVSELADKNLDGRVVAIAGVRIAGLGGVFAEKIWYPQFDANLEPEYPDYETAIDDMMQAEKYKEFRRLKAEGKEPDGLPSPAMIGKALLHKSTIFWNTWAELNGQPADVLVTHEAPSCHPNGFVALDVLAQSMGVKTMFHGHHHEHIAYGEASEILGFKAFSVGFQGVTDINGKIMK